MELYVLRHGITEWNISGRLQGAHDTPLTEDGRQLAKETGIALRDVRIDAAVTSPLSRAYDTAVLVLGDRLVTGKTTAERIYEPDEVPDPRTYVYPLTLDDRLKEIDFGLWEGRHTRGEPREVPKEALESYFDTEDGTVRAPEGESLNDVLARTRSFLDDCLNRREWEDKRILVSTHGGLSRALLHHIWGGRDFWHGSVPPNCCVSIIKAENGRIVSLDADHIFYEREPARYYPFGEN